MSNITKEMLNDEQKYVLEDLIPKVKTLIMNDKYRRLLRLRIGCFV